MTFRNTSTLLLDEHFMKPFNPFPLFVSVIRFAATLSGILPICFPSEFVIDALCLPSFRLMGSPIQRESRIFASPR